MFASARSIRKAAIARGEIPERKVVPHNNKSYKVGRKYYVQNIVDEHGDTIKSIVHLSMNISRKKCRLKKCMANKPR